MTKNYFGFKPKAIPNLFCVGSNTPTLVQRTPSERRVVIPVPKGSRWDMFLVEDSTRPPKADSLSGNPRLRRAGILWMPDKNLPDFVIQAGIRA